MIWIYGHDSKQAAISLTKKDKPRKTKTISVEDVPGHAVDVVVVNVKVINELREVIEESKEHVGDTEGHHEGTSSLEGFTIDECHWKTKNPPVSSAFCS